MKELNPNIPELVMHLTDSHKFRHRIRPLSTKVLVDIETTATNLTHLRRFLQTIPQHQLEMQSFYVGLSSENAICLEGGMVPRVRPEANPNDCGSACCALGWSTLCPHPALQVESCDFYLSCSYRPGPEDYQFAIERYSNRVYPILNTNPVDAQTRIMPELWDQVFGMNNDSRMFAVLDSIDYTVDALRKVHPLVARKLNR